MSSAVHGRSAILRAMSQENVEIVRAANVAFLSGDIEKALDGLDPEIEWHATVGANKPSKPQDSRSRRHL